VRPDRRAAITADARCLITLWPRSASCYYDEVDDCFHYHHPDGLLEISTAWLDNTIYYLRFVDECLRIEVRRLDNYKRHLTAKFVDAEMDEDDWAMLGGILARLVQTARSREQLGKIALEPVWDSLLAALFPADDWGRRPTRCPCRKTDSYAQAAALRAVREKAHRYVAWEWKEWHDAGVASLNKLAFLRQRQIRISYPAAAELAAVFDSADFTAAVLDWFERKLSPAGLSLIAISPFDEMQGFALVPSPTLGALTAALSSLCIEHQLAAPRPA
jgi:hypothetical protein